MTLSLDDLVVKTNGHIETNVGQETLLLSIESGRYFSFDGIAQEIWAAIDGSKSVRDIVKSQAEKYDVDRSQVEEDTLAFLSDLIEFELAARETA